MSELIDFIFVDQDFQVVEQAGLHDCDVAFERAQILANEKGQMITVLQVMDQCTPHPIEEDDHTTEDLLDVDPSGGW